MKKNNKFKETELGMIPEVWEVTDTSKFCTQVTDGTHDSPKKKKEGYYLITSRHLKSQELDFENAYLISEKDYIEVNKRSKVDQYDILFGMIGTIGETYLEMNKEINYAIKNVGLFKFNGDLNKSKWFYYFLQSKIAQHYIQTHKSGSTQEYITLGSLRKFPIIVPKNKDEMISIIKILSDLDSKIDVLQKQNETLEKTGKAIFKQWFVDFEFPNEKGKPYQSSGGEMIESKLGDIPKGWNVEKLSNYIDVQRGLSYKGKFLSKDETDIPMVNLGTIAPHKGYRKEGIKFYTGEHKERHTVKTGDIVIANTDITQKRDVLGSPAIVPAFDSEEILFTHHIYAVRNKYFPNLFLYYLFQKSDYKERAVTFATGTTVLALPKDAILDYEFVIPSKEVFNKFGILAESIFNKIILNTKDLLSLQKTRDLLLPKLMTGKIRVKVNE